MPVEEEEDVTIVDEGFIVIQREPSLKQRVVIEVLDDGEEEKEEAIVETPDICPPVAVPHVGVRFGCELSDPVYEGVPGAVLCVELKDELTTVEIPAKEELSAIDEVKLSEANDGVVTDDNFADEVSL